MSYEAKTESEKKYNNNYNNRKKPKNNTFSMSHHKRTKTLINCVSLQILLKNA